jgi:hypothetical protein
MEVSLMKIRSFLITVIMLISATVALTPSIAKADIYVYDNNDQYLGILLELKAGYLTVFMPSLGASWYIEYDEIGYCFDTAYFDSEDCSVIRLISIVRIAVGRHICGGMNRYPRLSILVILQSEAFISQIIMAKGRLLLDHGMTLTASARQVVSPLLNFTH